MLRTTLKKHLSALRRSQTFERGTTYAQDGRVLPIDESDGVSAIVQGTRQYTARIWEERGRLSFECSCPVGRDGDFCKHCVALGLVWMSVGKTKGTRRSKRDIRREAQGLRKIVESIDKQSLNDIVLEAAQRDKFLRQRLLLFSTDETDRKRAMEEWKSSFQRAADPRDYVPWNEMTDFADGIITTLRGLDEWLEAGRFEEAADLSEWAVAKVSDIVSFCDDDGDLSRVFERLAELHLRACEHWKPDPQVLEKRLRALAKKDESGVFYDFQSRYRRLLGSTRPVKRTRAIEKTLPPRATKPRKSRDT